MEPTTLLLQVSPAVHPTSLKVIAGPGLLGLLGLIVYIPLLMRSINTKESVAWRHLGTAMVIAGWLWSGQRLLKLWDPQTGAIYQGELAGQYTKTAHYVVPTIGLVILIAIGIAETCMNKSLQAKLESSEQIN
jgi:hypothetical protein